MVLKSSFACVAFSLFAFGCHDHEHGAELTPKEEVAEACKHLETGEDVTIDLTSEKRAETFIHVRYALEFGGDEEASDVSGQVAYSSSGGLHYILLTKPLALKFERDDVEIDVEEKADERAACPPAAQVYEAQLPEGVYTFTFSGTPSADVKLTIHAAGSRHDHDHSH